jgi:hypothetical protein
VSAALIWVIVTPRRGRRIGCLGQQLQRISAGQVGERDQRGGEELPQRVTQPQSVPSPFPDQRLVGAGHYLDRLSLVTVPGDRAQLMGIAAHHLRQGVRISGIAFRARDAAPLPVAGHLQWVDRTHPIPRGDQRTHPRATIGLDPHRHPRCVTVLLKVLGDQLMQPGDPGDPLLQPGLSQHSAYLVLELDVMVLLSPVVPHEQQTRPPLLDDNPVRSLRENHQRPNEQVLHRTRQADIPSAVNSPDHRQRHDLTIGLHPGVLVARVLTHRRLPGRSLHLADPVTLIRLTGLGVTGLFWPRMWLCGGLGSGGGGQADDLVPRDEAVGHLAAVLVGVQPVAAGSEVR